MKQPAIALVLVLASAAGCGKKKETPAPAAGSAAMAADPAPKTDPAPTPAPAPSGPMADKTKEFLGLNLPPMGAWKPEWDPDAKVAKWTNDDYFTGIVIRIVDDKLDTIDDLKEAAPMMMQVGTAIATVEETKTTDKGWYSAFSYDEGKSTMIAYVRKFGGSQIVCSGNTTPRKDPTGMGGITKEEIITACESVTVK